MDIVKNFIVFEGMDGGGKTTQSRLLEQFLKERGETVRWDCEPTDGVKGQEIRSMLAKKTAFDPLKMAYLFGEDREEHLFGENGILSFTKKGGFVISDRYFYSSIAYQSLDVPFDTVKEINATFPEPEYLIFIDLPVEVSLERLGRRKELDIFEKRATLEKVRANYLKQIKQLEKVAPMGQKRVILDGRESIKSLQSKVEGLFL